MGPPRISVILCTYNPRPPVLDRVVRSLQAQTYPRSGYELVVVDNRSQPPVAPESAAWHPAGRLVREDETGLTPARLRGIRETAAPLIVFIDDDNVLEPDYLRTAAEIAEAYPQIGAFGASMKGEFEEPPSPAVAPYVEYLAVSEIDRDHWSNFDSKWTMPSGGGMCLRRSVAEQYARLVTEDPVRRALGRSGQKLTSGEDHDMAMTAIDLGLGIGRFHRLRLTHIIAPQRLTEDYMVRLYAGIGECNKVLAALRPQFAKPRKSRMERLRFWFQLLRGPAFTRRILWRRRKAEQNAERALKRRGQ